MNKCKDCENGEDIHQTPKCTPKRFQVYKLNKYELLGSNETDPAKKNEEIFNKVIKSLSDNGPVICRWKHSAQVWSSQTKTFDEFYEDDSELNMTTWVSVVGHYNASETKLGRFVLQSYFGHNVGYYGFFLIEASADKNTQGILDECYGIEVNPV